MPAVSWYRSNLTPKNDSVSILDFWYQKLELVDQATKVRSVTFWLFVNPHKAVERAELVQID